MMVRVLFLLLILLGLGPALEAQALTCANKPVGATTLATIHFDTSDGEGQLWDLYPGAGQIQQPSGVQGNASASILSPGQGTGGQQVIWPKPGNQQPLTNLYSCFRWKINASFVGIVTNNKLVFQAAQDWTYGKAGINGVLSVPRRAAYPPFEGGNPGLQMLFGTNSSTSIYNNSHACAADFGLICYPNVNDTSIQRDTWYEVELYTIASSCTTCRNATVKWWIDGVLQGNYTNLNYGDGIVNEFQINHTWDNQLAVQCGPPTNPSNTNGRDCRYEQAHYFDELLLAAVGGTPAGGGGGSSPPPPSPPPATPPPTPTPPPPPPSGAPGTVGDLSATAVNTTRASIQFTAVNGGTGNPAKYDIRINRDVMSWGSAQSVSAGTCSPIPFAPGVMNQVVSCNIDGLTAGYTYKIQLVGFRGTMNLDAVYGNLSNVASVTMQAETPPPTPPPPTPPPTPPSPPPGISAPTNLELRSADTYRVVNKGDIWELRGVATPYVLYKNGVCGTCDVVGYSLVFSTDLNTIGVEFVPGKYQYLDTTLNEWVVISGPIVGITGASVTGSFAYAGTIPAGFNVYWSASPGGSKVRLPLYTGVWDRGFYDSQHSFGCYQVAGYDGTGVEGPLGSEACTSSGPGSTRDIGQITPRKVIDFAGAVWELQGVSAPYVMYKDGVCECTLAGYSLRYKTGVVEMEYLPGKWVRRDATLNEWVITEP